MTSIVLRSTSGPDGKLHLEVPVGAPNTEFEVKWWCARSWLDHLWSTWTFLGRTAGAWQGDVERPDTGPPRSTILSDDLPARRECLDRPPPPE